MARSAKEIEQDRQAATAKPKEQVIAEHVAAAGAVPLVIADSGEEFPDITPGVERPEDATVWGEVISTDGQVRQELFSASGDIDGRKFHRSQEIITGVRCRIFKVLIPSIEFPQDEEIRIGTANTETEQALAGNMGPANKKCQEMGCERVYLRGRGLVFVRHTKKFRFIPEGRP